jgi:hypothetical protein
MGQGALDQVGEELFDDGVAAVVGLGLGELERAVGEHRVVPVGGEQLALALGGGFGGEPADPAHDQPPVAAVGAAGGERGVGHLSDLGVGDPLAGLVVVDRVRVLDRHPGALVDGGEGAADLGVHPGGD